MGELIKSVLGGGWSLIVGWILPTLINAWLFIVVVLPQMQRAAWLSYEDNDATRKASLVVIAGAVVGIALASLQTPLYRLLEGYVGWRPSSGAQRRGNPWSRLLALSHRHQLERKQVLLGRYDRMELERMEAASTLRDELRDRLDEVRADRRLDGFEASDRNRGAAQQAILREQVRRYPVSDQQVVPTRLGNAIRRIEEYGYDRYKLDSQTLWYELLAVAPDQAVRDVERSRIAVDFMVCLLFGHVVLAIVAMGSLPAAGQGRPILVLTGVGLLVLARLWYLVAVSATDDWAAAVRSLVNLGRRPLILALGLLSPTTLEDERTLWGAVSRLSARPYDERSKELDGQRDSGK